MSVPGNGNPRILVMTAPYGEGHNRASEAIIEAFDELVPAAEVVLIDYFRMFVNDALVAASRQAYLQSIKKLPASYGVFYRSIEILEPDSTIRRTIDSVGRRNFKEYLAKHDYDTVISLYPIPSGALSHLRERGDTDAFALTVVTDYTCHPEWIHHGTDAYVVGSESVAEAMVERGVDREKLYTLGIPVRAAFRGRERRRAKGKRPSVLVMAGAYGALSGVRDVVDALELRCEGLDVTFVCGRAIALKRKLTEVTSKWERRPRVLGFIEDVAGEMLAADLLISKAGGITVSEALALGTPILVYRTIPGQEARNAEFLGQIGAGVSVRTAAALNQALDEMLGKKTTLAKMAKAAAGAGKPEAAKDIVKLVLDKLGDRGKG